VTEVTLQALGKVGGKGIAKKMSLQTTAENLQGRRRHDVA